MKSKTFFKRFLSLFLAVLMFTSIVPAGTITAQAGSYPTDWRSWKWKDFVITNIDGQEWKGKIISFDFWEAVFSKGKDYDGIIRLPIECFETTRDFSCYNKDDQIGSKYVWYYYRRGTNVFSLKCYNCHKLGAKFRGSCDGKEYSDPSFPYRLYLDGSYSNQSSAVKTQNLISKLSANVSKGSSSTVTISSTVKAYTSPNYASPANITLNSGQNVVVTEVSGNYGKINYNGQNLWVNLNYCSYVKPTVTKPAAPTIRLTSSSILSRGELINVSWDSVYNAKYYSAYLYNSSGALVQSYSDIYSTSATFQALEAETYTVKVIAHNSLYSSDPGTLAQTITVKGPSTVTYLNDDGTVIAQQSVEYGKNATAPVAPEKKGYTFKNWNGSLTNITKDTTLTAEYTINQYIVNFVDSEGAVIESQMVTYGEDATPPSAELVPLPKEGDYVFAGWDSTKYLDVYNENKSDPIVINALYEWNNKELPITCKVTSASRQPDGYYVYFDLTNYPDSITRGRAVVALKTTNGKLVYMTESAAFSIPAGGTKSNMEVFVPCESAATVVEVIIVDSYTTGVPISTMQSSSIEQGLMWSKWLDLLPDDVDTSDSEVESRQEYRYRDKTYTTASTKTKSGWTYYNTTSAVGSWSAWQWNVISGFNYEDKMREVQTQDAVSSYNYKTQYNYNRWSNSSSGGSRFGPCKGTWNSTYCGNYQERGWSDSALGWVYTKYSSQFGGNYSCYGSSSNPWYNQWTREVVSSTNYGTQYRYRDTTYTHHFYKWDDTKWSEWNTVPITATSDRQVEEKTTYRYKSISAGIEDVTGVKRKITTSEDTTFVGEQIVVDKLDAALAGKNITLFISKYNASSDFTNEYVAQSTVGEDGSFTFDYVLREEPTVETGDYIISIGIEGTTCMQQIGVIEAPKAQYTVKFVDWNGTIISEQIVTEGKNAMVPEEIPVRAGYAFVGWNNSCTNIQSDLEISPIYSENVYTVVYIDWRNERFETQTYKYGEPLIAPDFDDCDSGYAIGWDVAIDGETVVTSNMVVTAVYDTKTFTVDFYDCEGNVVDSQTIEYDGVAEIPELPEDDGVVYYDWDISEEDVMNVKENIAVFPSYEFEETTATPTASVTTGAYDSAQTVELSCETEDALIYYTLNGTDPADDMNVLVYGDWTLADLAPQNVVPTEEKWTYDLYTPAGEWSEWSTTPHTSSETIEVETRTIISSYNYQTKYHYYRYAENYMGGTSSSVFSSSFPNYYEYDFDYQLSVGQVDSSGVDCYKWYYNGADWCALYQASPFETQEAVSANYTTQYRYRTRAKTEHVDSDTMVDESDTISNVQKWIKFTEIPITSSTELNFYASSFGKNDSENAEEIYAFGDDIILNIHDISENFKGTVVDEVCTTLITDLSELSVSYFDIDGYNTIDVYYDSAFTSEVDFENDTLSGVVDVYPKYEVSTYTVTFMRGDTVVDTQTVKYLDSAVSPEMENDGTLVFVGWDDSLDFITEDTILNAIYKEESEIIKISLNRTSYTLAENDTFELVPALSGTDLTDDISVIYRSADTDVAIVYDDGTILGVGKGQTTIYAETDDGSAVAECQITVNASPNYSICLKDLSTLGVDDLGYLREIPLTNNTVDNILAQLQNNPSTLTFTNASGIEITGTGLVGTGTVITLKNGDEVLDTIMAVMTGDITCDGYINNRDIAYSARALLGLQTAEEYQLLAMDANGDGKVNNRDVALLARYLVGKEIL